MPNKNLCSKCNKKHFPPTGKKCKYAKKGLTKSITDSNVIPQDGVPAQSNSDSDSNVMPQGGVPDLKLKKSASMFESLFDSSSAEEETSTQLQILQELKRVNSRLDAVEGRIAQDDSSRQKCRHRKIEQSKLSRTSFTNKSSKKSVNHVNNTSNCDTDSSSESDCNVPSLAALKSSANIQRRIDERLRELEMLPSDSGVTSKGKVKSKRGGQ